MMPGEEDLLSHSNSLLYFEVIFNRKGGYVIGIRNSSLRHKIQENEQEL
jgi:hypothetical protein